MWGSYIAIGIARHPSSALMGAVFIAAELAFATRLLLVGMTVLTDDEVVVRTFFATRRLTRRDIEDFRLRFEWGWKAILVLVTGGTVLDVMVVGDQRRNSDRVHALRQWLREPRTDR